MPRLVARAAASPARVSLRNLYESALLVTGELTADSARDNVWQRDVPGRIYRRFRFSYSGNIRASAPTLIGFARYSSIPAACARASSSELPWPEMPITVTRRPVK